MIFFNSSHNCHHAFCEDELFPHPESIYSIIHSCMHAIYQQQLLLRSYIHKLVHFNPGITNTAATGYRMNLIYFTMLFFNHSHHCLHTFCEDEIFPHPESIYVQHHPELHACNLTTAAFTAVISELVHANPMNAFASADAMSAYIMRMLNYFIPIQAS